MSDNTPMDKWQKHQSNALAIAGLGVLIIMNVLAYSLHIWPAWEWIAACIIVTGFFSYINFTNTVETNEPWKSYGAFLALAVVAIIYALPIGSHAINQP